MTSSQVLPEPRLLRVAVWICENCIAGTPGQCHEPGCLFIRFNVNDIPGGGAGEHALKWMVEHLDTPGSGSAPPNELIGAERQCPADPKEDLS